MIFMEVGINVNKRDFNCIINYVLDNKLRLVLFVGSAHRKERAAAKK